MRLLYISVSMPFGSGEAFFVPEVKGILKRGVEVLIVPRSPTGDMVNKDGKELPSLSLRKPLFSVEILWAAIREFLWNPWRCVKAIGMLLPGSNLNTLARNLAVLPKALWIARLARNWGADHIHAQWLTTTSTMAMVAGELTDIPWSCTAHRGDILESNLLSTKAKRASFLRFISQDGLALATSLNKAPLQGKIVVLHLCVEMPPSPPEKRDLAKPPVLLCAANLIERKGQPYLIEAVGILQERGIDVTLWLAGEGNARDQLAEMVERKGLQDRVFFLGQLGHEDLFDMYRRNKIDIVVLPTLHEGIPVTLIEAMGFGIPIISTGTGGIPELLREDAGIMVPPKNSLALADAIERLIRDSDLRQQMAVAGRRRVEEEFSVEAVVDSLLEHIQAAAVKTSYERAAMAPTLTTMHSGAY